MDAQTIKQVVGFAAVDTYVASGMKLGLGTGSTAIHAVRRVAALVAAGTLSDLRCVSTSFDTRIEAQKHGLQVYELNDGDIDGHLDLSIDGADEVDRASHALIKGGGGALTLEKITEYNSDRFIVVVDEAKLSNVLGSTFAVPLEVIPAARVAVTHASARLGATAVMRTGTGKMGPVITDNGNIILDLTFAAPFDAPAMELELNAIPGVVENGIFARCPRPTVLVGRADGTVETLK